MRTHVYEARTDLPPDALWPVLAEVARWPESDANIERLHIAAAPAPGVPFTLKPKGGPTLRFTIAEFVPPTRYADLCHLWLGTMQTVHELLPDGSGTKIRVTISVSGLLRALWWRVAARKHAAGLPAQTERFIAHARARRAQQPTA